MKRSNFSQNINRDFSIKKYVDFCHFLKSNNKQVIPIVDYFRANKPKSDVVFLRHDVDILPYRALKMAIIESAFDIKSTYYFRKRKYVFNEQIIKTIHSLGHEIGYHYETLSDAKGDTKLALKFFSDNLADFNKLVNIRTISMHGSSLSPYDNKDLWEHYDIASFGILGEAYLSLNWNDLSYYTDAGGSWSSPANFRDKTHLSKNQKSIKSTNELMSLMLGKNNFCINIHPDRWNEGIFWQIENVSKRIRNYIKITLKRIKERE